MADTFSCTGEHCPIIDGGVVRCTAKNCPDRTPVKYDPDEFFSAERNSQPLLWRDDLITTSEFMTHSGPNGFEIHFRTPDREKYLEVEKACQKVIGHGKRQTNADRIRAMDLEDLATILTLNSYVPPPWCAQFDEPCRYLTEDPVRCDLCALDWLQQEVDTDDN